MTQIEKLIEKVMNSPYGHRYKEINAILIHLGFIMINTIGSHHNYYHLSINVHFSLPVHNREIKPCYVRQLTKIITKYGLIP